MCICVKFRLNLSCQIYYLHSANDTCDTLRIFRAIKITQNLKTRNINLSCFGMNIQHHQGFRRSNISISISSFYTMLTKMYILASLLHQNIFCDLKLPLQSFSLFKADKCAKICSSLKERVMCIPTAKSSFISLRLLPVSKVCWFSKASIVRMQ